MALPNNSPKMEPEQQRYVDHAAVYIANSDERQTVIDAKAKDQMQQQAALKAKPVQSPAAKELASDSKGVGLADTRQKYE